MSIFGLFGPPNIEKLRQARDVKALVQALGYNKDSAVQKHAADALVEIGAPVVSSLLAALEQSKPELGQTIQDILVRIGIPAVEPIVSYLKQLQDELSKGLTDNPLKTPLKEVAASLNRVNWGALRFSVAALGQIGDERAVGTIIGILKSRIINSYLALGQILVKLNRPGVAFDIARLEKDKQVVRQAAAEALIRIGAPAVKPVRDTLDGVASLPSTQTEIAAMLFGALYLSLARLDPSEADKQDIEVIQELLTEILVKIDEPTSTHRMVDVHDKSEALDILDSAGILVTGSIALHLGHWIYCSTSWSLDLLL